MHRVFLSDLHLEEPATPAFLRFVECLKVEAARVDEIYVLGDLVEMWVGDDDDSPTAQALTEALRGVPERCAVYLMHGNRDFLFGDAFAAAAGVTLLDDPCELPGRTLLCHGDTLCTDDVDYQALRTMVRDPKWQADILERTLAERQAFGRGLREQSRATSANKAANIMDVNPEAVADLLEQHGATRLIHGHTHRPGVHGNRFVLGAWEHCGWLCRERDGAYRLECFSLRRPYASSA